MPLFNKVRERRISKLARAVARSKTYDQHKISHACGTPGCMIGHADVVFPRASGSWRRFLFGDPPTENRRALKIYDRDVFSGTGCGRAGKNSKKAAEYIRKMARDLKAALAA